MAASSLEENAMRVRFRAHVLVAAALAVFTYAAGPALAGGQPGIGWTVVPSPNPSDQGNYLTAIAGVSATNLWAVGAAYRADTSTPGTLTEHWDGTKWTVVPSPNFNEGYNELYGVDAVSSTDAWAVGYHNISLYGSEKTMALHWDGIRWRIVPTRNIGQDANQLLDVAAVAADDVWAVGFGASTSNEVGRPLIQRWDGARWSKVQSPRLGSGFGGLNGVVALAPDDVWAVGSHDDATLVEHWDGRAWTVVPSPNGTRAESELYAVSATGPSDIWAVGDSYDGRGSDSLVEHWDGTAWTVVPSLDGAKPSTSLYGTLALGPEGVWAVGSTYDPIQVSYATFTEHWDGSAWTIVPSPNPGPIYDQLLGMAGFPGGDVWAVGQAYVDTLTIRTTDG
jgi:hypothetical protein